MRAVAYFKVFVSGPLAVYLFFLVVKQVVEEAGHVSWSHLLVGVLTRLIYAGIFTALCLDGVRALRAQKRS
jgi:hypothetical protein